MPEESEKSEQDSPLKEPLKKKGNDIHNPYPNFKVRNLKYGQQTILAIVNDPYNMGHKSK